MYINILMKKKGASPLPPFITKFQLLPTFFFLPFTPSLAGERPDSRRHFRHDSAPPLW